MPKEPALSGSAAPTTRPRRNVHGHAAATFVAATPAAATSESIRRARVERDDQAHSQAALDRHGRRGAKASDRADAARNRGRRQCRGDAERDGLIALCRADLDKRAEQEYSPEEY